MTDKERVDKLSRLLRRRIPEATIAVDAPSRPNGDWFIDMKLGKRSFVIELRPTLGFGLSSTPADGIGEGPDEFFEDERGVVERIATLLRKKARSEPQRVRLLQQLRERMQMSQVAVAAKLKERKPTISKIERREDMNLSTLRRYVRALGGELQVMARFPDGAVEIGTIAVNDERETEVELTPAALAELDDAIADADRSESVSSAVVLAELDRITRAAR